MTSNYEQVLSLIDEIGSDYDFNQKVNGEINFSTIANAFQIAFMKARLMKQKEDSIIACENALRMINSQTEISAPDAHAPAPASKTPALASDAKAPAPASDAKAPAPASDAKAPAPASDALASKTQAPAQAAKAPAQAPAQAQAQAPAPAKASASDAKAPAQAAKAPAKASASDAKAPAQAPASKTQAQAQAAQAPAPAKAAPAKAPAKASDAKAPAKASDAKAPAQASAAKAPAQASAAKAPAPAAKSSFANILVEEQAKHDHVVIAEASFAALLAKKAANEASANEKLKANLVSALALVEKNAKAAKAAELVAAVEYAKAAKDAQTLIQKALDEAEKKKLSFDDPKNLTHYVDLSPENEQSMLLLNDVKNHFKQEQTHILDSFPDGRSPSAAGDYKKTSPHALLCKFRPLINQKHDKFSHSTFSIGLALNKQKLLLPFVNDSDPKEMKHSWVCPMEMKNSETHWYFMMSYFEKTVFQINRSTGKWSMVILASGLTIDIDPLSYTNAMGRDEDLTENDDFDSYNIADVIIDHKIREMAILKK